eukprot:GILJ01013138.1.p1 GENE.GILJ01013138.1~~GILJ01013138.1.p1  ORF type:complete len:633 (-),score=29.27 GILJ01013138.1:110-2008(-)
MKRRSHTNKLQTPVEPKRQRSAATASQSHTTEQAAKSRSPAGSNASPIPRLPSSPTMPKTYFATFSLADQAFAYVLSSSLISASPYLECMIRFQAHQGGHAEPLVPLSIPLDAAFSTCWPRLEPSVVLPCLERSLSFLSLGFQGEIWRILEKEDLGLIMTVRGLAQFLEIPLPPLTVSSMNMTDPSRWLLIDTFDSTNLPALFEQSKTEKAKSEFAKAFIGLDVSVQRELYRRLFTAEMSVLVRQLGYTKLHCELARSTYQAAQLTGFRKEKCKSTCGKLNQNGGTFALNPNLSIEEWTHGIISYTDLQTNGFCNAKLIGDLGGLVTGREPCKVLYVLYDRTRIDRRNLCVEHPHFEIISRDYVEYIFRDFDLQLRLYDLAVYGAVDELLMGMSDNRYQACLDAQCMTLYGTMGFFDAVAESIDAAAVSNRTTTVVESEVNMVAREEMYREKVERALMDRPSTHNLAATFAKPVLPIPRWIMCENIASCPVSGLAWRHLYENFYIVCQRTKDGLLPIFVRAQQLRAAAGAKWIMEGPQTIMARRMREILQLLGNPVTARVRHHSDSCSCDVEIFGRVTRLEKCLAGHVWFCFIGITDVTEPFKVELRHPSIHFVDWAQAAFEPTIPLELIRE